jgi:hypothetical protein
MTERVNIGPMAKDFRANGAPDNGAPTKNFSYRNEEAIQAWHDMKPEYFALTAVLTDRAINRAVDQRSQRPPFGLIEKSDDPYNRDKRINPPHVTSVEQILDKHDLAWSIDTTLERAVTEELAFIPSVTNPDGEMAPVQSVFKRYKDLSAFRKKYITEDLEDEFTMIYNGSGTAGIEMVGVIDVLPKVYEIKGLQPVAEELTQTVANSFPLIAYLAMQHIYDFGEIETKKNRSFRLDNFEYVPDFDPYAFRLVETKKGKQLTLSPNLGSQDAPDSALLEKSRSTLLMGPDIIGCPAMVNFDGTSAIRKLWDWNVEIAEAVYTRKF